MADHQLGQRHYACAEVPAKPEGGDLTGGDVGTTEFFGAVHIETASTHVGGGIPRGKASLKPLAGGDFSTFDSGGHFCKITGAWAHAANCGMS